MIQRGENPGTIAAWLLANAQSMKENMFFNPNIDWLQLEPYHILALRACTPSNVFTEAAKAGYLTRISGDHDRVELANCMFTLGDDYAFVKHLPDSLKELQPQIVQLVQLAYRKGIRNADRLVRDM